MRKDIYYCDKCGEPMGTYYDPETEQTVLVVGEAEQFHGPPQCSYERKDICFSCLVKAMRKWFYDKAAEGKDASKPDTFDFSLTKEFCEILKEKDE